MRNVGTGASGGGGGGSITNPTQISGLLFWVRADLGIHLNAGFVSEWDDQSGAGDSGRNLVQTTPANQPGYNATDAAYGNQPTVSFSSDSSQGIMSGVWDITVNAPVTVFMVGQNAAGGARQFYLSATGWNVESLASELLLVNLNWTSQPITPSIMGFISHDPNSAIFANAELPVAVGADADTMALTQLFVGSNFGANLNLEGKIAEIFMYNRVLTGLERHQVFAYLSARYGIPVGS